MKKIVIANNYPTSLNYKGDYFVEMIESSVKAQCKTLNIGKDSKEEICKAIDRCAIYIYLFANNPSKSDNKKEDLIRMWTQYAVMSSKKVLFISLDGTTLPPAYNELGGEFVFDLSANYPLDTLPGLIQDWLDMSNIEEELTEEDEPDNDAKANLMFTLGNDYFHGWHGRPQDYDAAACCYWHAAHAGLLFAKLALGNCYHHGYGVDQNDEKAFHYYLQAEDTLSEEMYAVANSSVSNTENNESKRLRRMRRLLIVAKLQRWSTWANLANSLIDIGEAWRKL